MLVTVANKVLTVKRLIVSPTATRRCLPSFFFNAVSKALVIQEATSEACRSPSHDQHTGTRKHKSICQGFHRQVLGDQFGRNFSARHWNDS